MAQQILQSGGLLESLQDKLTIDLFGNFLTRKLGQVLLYRVTQQQFPLLHEHHRSDRYQWLGHGIDAEDRIFSHRRTCGRI